MKSHRPVKVMNFATTSCERSDDGCTVFLCQTFGRIWRLKNGIQLFFAESIALHGASSSILHGASLHDALHGAIETARSRAVQPKFSKHWNHVFRVVGALDWSYVCQSNQGYFRWTRTQSICLLMIPQEVLKVEMSCFHRWQERQLPGIVDSKLVKVR